MGTNVSRIPAASIFKLEELPEDEGSRFIRNVDTNVSKYTVMTSQNIKLLILPAVLCTSETWSLRLRYEHRFKVSENNGEHLKVREK
jgi:hypothetical protein